MFHSVLAINPTQSWVHPLPCLGLHCNCCFLLSYYYLGRKQSLPMHSQSEKLDPRPPNCFQDKPQGNSSSSTSKKFADSTRLWEGVIEVNPNALYQADLTDKERKAKDPWSLYRLHGIPVLLNDNIVTKNKLNTTVGLFALLKPIVSWWRWGKPGQLYWGRLAWANGRVFAR